MSITCKLETMNKCYIFCIACASLLLVVGVSAQTLLDVATSLNASSFVSYVNTAGLAPAFTKNGQFTIFVPTNAAFEALSADVKAQLSKDPEFLRKVLMYHGVDGITLASQLQNEMLVDSLVLDAKIRINVYMTSSQKVVLASGSEIVRTDINASNGIIHMISRVMYPLPISDAVQYLAQHNNLGTLLYSVAMTKTLPGTLQGPGPFTIFAPNNDAFDKLRVGYWSDLFNQNYTAYYNMLEYHVVRGTLYSAGLRTGPLRSITGQMIHVHVNNNGVQVNNATVVTADQSVNNGVIHVIDRLLIPS